MGRLQVWSVDFNSRRCQFTLNPTAGGITATVSLVSLVGIAHGPARQLESENVECGSRAPHQLDHISQTTRRYEECGSNIVKMSCKGHFMFTFTN